MSSLIFGGSFDPIHLAHIALAARARDYCGANRVIIAPTAQNPLKEAAGASREDRLTMLKLAIKRLPWIEISRVEIDLPAGEYGYSIDTVRKLVDMNVCEARPFFLMGSDCVASFERWREPRALVEETRILLVRRGTEPIRFDYPHTVLEGPLYSVSSMEIRRLIKEELPFRHLLNEEVYDYVRSRRLYR